MNGSSCVQCNSADKVRTANGIPICDKCINLEREFMISYEKSRKTFYPEINEIIENKLFLGNYDQARVKDGLINNKITHILVCGTGLDIHFPDEYTYEKIEIEDFIEQDIKQFFNKANEFIDKGEVVFVHCHAGVSRSATIVIAYVMYKNKMRFEEAYAYVKKKRSVIFPNHRFREDLRNYEKELFGDSD